MNPQNRQWWPEKGKGITIKAREIEQVIEALDDAREQAQSVVHRLPTNSR